MNAQRRRWISWIPAIVLSVLIVAAVVTSIVLARAGIGGPAPKPTEGQVSDLNWSAFTPEGVAYIERSREVRLDFSDKGEDALTLGLPSDGDLVIGPHSEELDYAFTFNGGGAGRGGAKLYVSQLTIRTEDGRITEVVAPLSEILNFRQTLAKLELEIDRYGWEPLDTDALFDRVGVAAAAGEPYEFTFGPADLVGVPVTATAACDASNYCVITYLIQPESDGT